MSSWARLLEDAEPAEHVVQLYGEDDQLLTRNVSRYLREGLRRGDGLLVIATPEHSTAFTRQLQEQGEDPSAAVADGRLVVLDAEATLARFMVDGQPDWERFEGVIGDAMRQVRPQPGRNGLRAYGEMVGVLWEAGQVSAAIQLEEHWNRLLSSHSFTLFGAYPIDILGSELQTSVLAAIVRAHTHVLAGPRTLLSRTRAKV
jgi:hypothetical protein